LKTKPRLTNRCRQLRGLYFFAAWFSAVASALPQKSNLEFEVKPVATIAGQRSETVCHKNPPVVLVLWILVNQMQNNGDSIK